MTDAEKSDVGIQIQLNLKSACGIVSKRGTPKLLDKQPQKGPLEKNTLMYAVVKLGHLGNISAGLRELLSPRRFARAGHARQRHSGVPWLHHHVDQHARWFCP